MKDYTLPIAFLLAPFLILSTGYIWTGQQIGLMVVFLVLMASMIENRWIKVFLSYVVAWQVCLFVNALIHPREFEQAIASGYTQVLFMLAGAMVYLTASKSKIKNETFFNIICVAAIIQTATALLQCLGVDIVQKGLSLIAPAKSSIGDRAFVGWLGNPNYLAAFLAMSIPFLFRKWWCFALPLIVSALVLSHTSAAAVSAGIGMAAFSAYLYKNEKLTGREFMLSLTLASLWVVWYAFLFHPSIVQVAGSPAAGSPLAGTPAESGANLVRGDIWAYALSQVTSTWSGFSLGLGPGAAWKYNYPLHSEWVTLFHQFGVIGIVLAAGYLLTAPRKNAYLFPAFIIGIINMAGNATLHIPVTAFLICMIAGLLERERNG